MANLKDFTFGNKSDSAISDLGWVINAGEVIQALDGSDTIIGSDIGGEFGIVNFGALDTGAGNDVVTGSGGGFGIFNQGSTLETGAGNDVVTGSGGYFGIFNQGSTLETGAGNDVVTGWGRDYGIFNGGSIILGGSTLDTSAGNDVITGSGGDYGIYNLFGTINTGAGNDVVTGSGRWYGIVNEYESILNTGAGNDVVTGSGEYSGIYNEFKSSINTGDGDDTVDALTGGFRGGGETWLGSGDDNLKGFGTGMFDGGDGTDVLTFNRGAYSIEHLYDGSYLIGGSMNVVNFEDFGVGADQTSFLAAAAAGTVTFA